MDTLETHEDEEHEEDDDGSWELEQERVEEALNHEMEEHFYPSE